MYSAFSDSSSICNLFLAHDLIQDQTALEAFLRHGLHIGFHELFAGGVADFEIRIQVHALLGEALGEVLQDMLAFMLQRVLVILDGRAFLDLLDQVHKVLVVIFVL
jgi:hypothetical protein